MKFRDKSLRKALEDAHIIYDDDDGNVWTPHRVETLVEDVDKLHRQVKEIMDILNLAEGVHKVK